VRPEIKFCGLTRPADAAFAASVGASFVGAVFAGGPRRISAAHAAEVLAAAGSGPRRVGVFASIRDAELEATVRRAGLNVIQLHDDPSVADVASVRERTGCAVWAVVRVAGAPLAEHARELFAVADAVLLDARRETALGGTGAAWSWKTLAGDVRAARGAGRFVLAGGLTPENVRHAIDILDPDIVDVSSGVESAPGVKDHARMRAFAEAVWA
jgi:phosphoribosylanthranilate isomerase